jgi:tRNA (pseudouridine54-N1)-methyltransferase
MRVFILRCRKASANVYKFEENIGAGSYLEIAAQCLGNSLFVSKDMRCDVRVHIVFEAGPEAPKTLTFDSKDLFYMGGFHEKALLAVIKKGLSTRASVPDISDSFGSKPGDFGVMIESGFYAARLSFEKLVRYYLPVCPVYHLSPGGQDIQTLSCETDSCYIFTDHIGMAKKSEKLLKRLDVKKISLGPKMLFASHCVVIINNHLDRKESQDLISL